MNPFGQFHFQGQKEGETILLAVHRHWFDILKQMLVIFLMILMLVGGLVYLPILFPILGTKVGLKILFLIENSFAMLTFVTFFLIWVDYYFDVWIITNKRIVNIEQKGLFIREVSELELENIQDITTEVVGVIPTFFNYGDVFVQTAAERDRFLFHNVPDPYGIKDLVMNLQEKVEKEEASNLGELIREKINK